MHAMFDLWVSCSLHPIVLTDFLPRCYQKTIGVENRSGPYNCLRDLIPLNSFIAPYISLVIVVFHNGDSHLNNRR